MKLNKSILISISLISIFCNVFSQPVKKQLISTKISQQIRIDGILDEAPWKSSSIATDFIQYDPYNGSISSLNTTVKVIYDNTAIYIGAFMFDNSPDSILTELCRRDDFEHVNADQFAIDIIPFNDGLNAIIFKVTASGVQSDVKLTPQGEDLNWDAVWKSAINITDSGWIAEIKIPYSAIRFPNMEKQVWGINFWRHIRRYREWSTWNFIDKKVSGELTQSGELHGIEHINAPLRLSVTPYFAGYLEKTPENQNYAYSFNYGMDLKYGINESFTLDMTLIPDYGQVESDDEILNLTPFEVRYNEKRQFFTEGTELFEKGGIFYSRRIGDKPLGNYNVQDSLFEGEEITENPNRTGILNATKITGRTKNGLGIGVFNAMSSNTFATIIDSNGKERKILTQAFTNYNIIAFDQSLRNNSYISFINTNVYRDRSHNTANVSGTELRLANKNNSFAIDGNLNVSQKYSDSLIPDFGHQYSLSFGKISGNFIFNVWQLVESDTYDPNDLGFLYNNNEFTNGLNIAYKIYNPVWRILNSSNTVSLNYSRLYRPAKFSSFQLTWNSWTTFENYLSVIINLGGSPVKEHDYFESRIPGRVFIRPERFYFNVWLSPDYRKTLAVDVNFGYDHHDFYDTRGGNFGIRPRLRVSDKLFIIHEFLYNQSNNNVGFVKHEYDSNNQLFIIFGKRKLKTITNTFTASYIFNNKTSLSFRLRHYISTADYEKYYNLDKEGYLENNSYTESNNINFNAFNIDMTFTWYFLPGSQVLIVWKNAIYSNSEELINNFFDNLNNTLNLPAINSFSIKLLYYMDYQYLKKKS